MKIQNVQAYDATYYFLQDFQSRTYEPIFSNILVGMGIFSDGTPLLGGVWDDWIQATEGKEFLTYEEAYESILRFLKNPYTEFEDAAPLIQFFNYIKKKEIKR